MVVFPFLGLGVTFGLFNLVLSNWLAEEGSKFWLMPFSPCDRVSGETASYPLPAATIASPCLYFFATVMSFATWTYLLIACSAFAMPPPCHSTFFSLSALI